jgi:hypothetical protein
MDPILKNTGKSPNAIRPSFANSRLLVPVIASAGAVGLSIGLIIPLISIVLEQRDISFIAIGLNAAVYSLAVLLTGPFLLLDTGHAKCGPMFQRQRSDCGELHVRDGLYSRHGRGTSLLQRFDAVSRPLWPFGAAWHRPGFFYFADPETGKYCNTRREQNIVTGNVLVTCYLFI